MKIFIGIDPGIDGYICAIFESGIIKKHPIPLITKGVIDVRQLITDLSYYKGADLEPIVIMEDVHALFQASKKSTWNFAHTVGVLESVVMVLDFPLHKVAPKKWQGILFEGIPLKYKPATKGKTEIDEDGEEIEVKTSKKPSLDTKAMALHAVTRLFPQFKLSDFYRGGKSTKVHDGLVDALCIAYYCKREHSR